MARPATPILIVSAVGAAVALCAAAGPSVFTEAQPGLWEISGAPGLRTPVRSCVADMTALARYEHRSSTCSARIINASASSANVDYSCGGSDFGHSQIDLLTPRSLRISTQGISGGLPFNYVLQARRVDDCPKSAAITRH